MTLTSKEEIFDYVYQEYLNNDQELSGAYFDFEVKAPKKDVLEAYAALQFKINGDYVRQILPSGEMISYLDDRFAADEEYQEIYEGNCEEFLRSFNESGKFTRFLEDPAVSEEEELDFVF